MKVINELSIRKKLHEHGNALQNILNSLSTIQREMMTEKSVEKVIDKRYEKHFNDKKMNDYLEKKWEEIFESKLFKTKKILSAIAIIFASLAFIGGVVELIRGRL